MGDKQGKRKEGREGEKGVEYISNTSRIGEKKHGNWINDNDNDAIILEPRFLKPSWFCNTMKREMGNSYPRRRDNGNYCIILAEERCRPK